MKIFPIQTLHLRSCFDMDPILLEELRQLSRKIKLQITKKIVHNLSQRKGGSVPNLTTHCKFFCQRPPQLRHSVLCSGGDLWEPCSDFQLCLSIRPTAAKEYQEPEEISLEITIHEEIMCIDRPVIKRKRGRPRKNPVWKDVL